MKGNDNMSSIKLNNVKRNENGNMYTITVSDKYMERLAKYLEIPEITDDVFTDFVENRLDLKDRVDYGHLDFGILPSRVKLPICTTLHRPKAPVGEVKTTDFIFFMELLKADRLGYVRNLGVILKSYLLSAYDINFSTYFYNELIQNAKNYIESNNLPAKVCCRDVLYYATEFKEAYNVI